MINRLNDAWASSYILKYKKKEATTPSSFSFDLLNITMTFIYGIETNGVGIVLVL